MKVLILGLRVMVLCVSLATLLAGQATTPSTIHNKTALRSGGPDCGGGWPTTMTFVLLKNAGITDNEEIDFLKTKTTRIASEKTGKDLYRQVYDVRYTKKSGQTIEAIAVHDASSEECSISGIDLYVISQRLGSH